MKDYYIIADIGSNWCKGTSNDDNLAHAKLQIQKAAECGVQAVKFQMYSPVALYGYSGASTAFVDANKFSLPPEWLPVLLKECTRNKVDFLCSVFSPSDIATVNPYVAYHKLASPELVYEDMLAAYRKTKKYLIVSTGGASEFEITRVFGYISNDRVILLQCVSAYPAPSTAYNLKALRTFRKYKPYKVGISDHSRDSYTLAAMAIGAGGTVFEKHFDATMYTDDNKTPDRIVSSCPEVMIDYVKKIDELITIWGSGSKICSEYENEFKMKYKRRIKIIRPVKEGEILSYGYNYGVFRSIEDDAKADHAYHYKIYNGKIANKDLKTGDGLFLKDIK